MYKLAEECAELAVACHHVADNRAEGLENLAEEIADVEVLIAQMKEYYGVSFERHVLAFRKKKLVRLDLFLAFQAHGRKDVCRKGTEG